MSDHTPTPWSMHVQPPAGVAQVPGIWIKDRHHRTIVETGRLNTFRLSAGNAARIVAAVNACEGLPTAALEGMRPDFLNGCYLARVAAEMEPHEVCPAGTLEALRHLTAFAERPEHGAGGAAVAELGRRILKEAEA